MRIFIRLEWIFAGCDPGASRLPYVTAARDEGLAGAFALASASGSFVAEASVRDDGGFDLLAVRPRGQCPSHSPISGVRCSAKELHGPDHVAHVPLLGGCEIHRWEDCGDWVLGCPSTSKA